MESIKITVTGAQATVTHAPLITSGMVGLPVELTFDDSWQMLNKVLVYRVGEQTHTQLNIDTCGLVPGKLLQPYRQLEIGVYGTDYWEGSVVIPTVWAKVGIIREAASPEGDSNADPALPIWRQLENRLEQLEKPQLLFEMNFPPTEGLMQDALSWELGNLFSFRDDQGKPRPWNDLWHLDPSLPADTDMVTKITQLLELVRQEPRAVVEIGVPNMLRICSAQNMCFINLFNKSDKLTLLALDALSEETAIGSLVLVSLDTNAMRLNTSVSSLADVNGWWMRVWR